MNRIKELRTERKMKQAELAQLLSCTPTAISNYETGFRSPDIETIHKLCDIFGCTADYLLGRSEVRTFELSPEEAELLRGFRALSPEGREYIRHTLALAALGHGEKNGALSDLERAT